MLCNYSIKRAVPRFTIKNFLRSITSRAIVYSEYGKPLDVLRLHCYEVPPPGEDEFLVRFLAAPINPADLNQIEGVYPKKPKFVDKFGTMQPSAIAGNEGLVEIIQPGKKYASMKWNLGDWAIMKQTTFGTWRTHAIAQEGDLLRIPMDGISPIEAATVSINPCTAYRMLLDFADMKSGDFFVQNGANSAVGKSAIQFAKIWGFRSINVIRERAGSEELRKELIQLGADYVITDAELADKELMKIKLATDWQSNVKLALNCVGGQNAMNMCRLLSDGAHIVTYGAMAKQPLKVAATLLIFKDFHFHGFWVSPWNDKHPEERVEMLKDIFGWMRDGRFKAPDCDVNWWEVDQSKEEAWKVFADALQNSSSRKQILAMRY